MGWNVTYIELVGKPPNPNKKWLKKIKKLIDKKLAKLDENNEEENQMIELDFLTLKDMLKKSCKDNKYFSKKNFLI